MVQDKVQWQAVVNMEMFLWIPSSLDLCDVTSYPV
jgi:hypothetical protein